MTYGTRTGGYPATSKWLHWLVAACVLLTVPVAIAMGRVAQGPTQDMLYNLHKSLGVLIFILVVLRLANRLILGAPMPAPGIESWQKKLSSATHGSIYLLLIAMPIVGYIANSAYGAPTPLFGLFNVPPIMGKNEPLSDVLFAIHRWAGFLLIALVGMHVAGALFHHFIRGDSVLQRMLPKALGGI